jgi:hypothetical protein
MVFIKLFLKFFFYIIVDKKFFLLEAIFILTWIRQVMPKGIEIKGFFVQKN